MADTVAQEAAAGLDADERAFFDAHGWLIVRAAVSPARVAELCAAVDAILPPALYERGAAPAPAPAPATDPMWEVASVSRMSPTIAAHTLDAAIARHAAIALGCERVQLLQDTLIVKAPRLGGRVEWHQDHTFTGYLEPARSASIRLALTPCTVESGCMQVIDASHTWGLRGDVRALTETHVADGLGALGGADGERVAAATRTITLEPGDLSLHHCLTFHRSLPNHSAHARKTLITRVFDGACTLVVSRLPSLAAAANWFPVDDAGHLEERAFPLLWPRAT